MDKWNPWWVTGLVDGEGCFQASVYLRSGSGQNGPFTKVDANPKFLVGLRADDSEILYGLKDFFGCGEVYSKRASPALIRRGHTNLQMVFVVGRLEDLITKIVPHFERYPLQSKKSRDFDLWAPILFFIRDNLSGTKGWARKFPDRVSNLQQMCIGLAQSRSFPGAH